MLGAVRGAKFLALPWLAVRDASSKMLDACLSGFGCKAMDRRWMGAVSSYSWPTQSKRCSRATTLGICMHFNLPRVLIQLCDSRHGGSASFILTLQAVGLVLLGVVTRFQDTVRDQNHRQSGIIRSMQKQQEQNTRVFHVASNYSRVRKWSQIHPDV
jgi:hypothetical protein